jgi:hypothetical protein
LGVSDAAISAKVSEGLKEINRNDHQLFYFFAHYQPSAILKVIFLKHQMCILSKASCFSQFYKRILEE